MKQLKPGVFVRSSHIQQMQSVVLVTDDLLVVVDPAYFPDELLEIRTFCRKFENGVRKQILILTHSDFDHIIGAHDYEGYEVIAAATWDSENEDYAIRRIFTFDSEYYVSRSWSGQMNRCRIDHYAGDGEHYTDLVFYHACGHTNDGLVTIHGRTAIVGDYLSALEFPFIYSSYRDYERTLAKLRTIMDKHDIDCVISQHGPAAVTRGEILDRIESSERYINDVLTLLSSAVKEGLAESEVLARGNEIHFAGAPISVGIQKFHEENVRMMLREFQQPQSQ